MKESRGTHPDYVPLHTHSSYSSLSNIAASADPETLVQTAQSLHLTHLALTDRETVSGIGRAVTSTHSSGVTLIPGVEFIVSDPVVTTDQAEALVLAKSYTGLKQIFSWVTHVKADELPLTPTHIEHGKDVIVLFNGNASFISDLLSPSQDTFYAFHTLRESQQTNTTARYAQQLGKSIVTGEIRSATTQDQKILKYISQLHGDYSLQKFRSLQDVTLAHQHEIFRYIRTPHELARTREVAESIHFQLPPDLTIRPHIVPEGSSPMEFLEQETMRHMKERGLEREYARLIRELEVIRDLGFPNHFLHAYERKRFYDSHDIPSRVEGSGNQSQVAYVLGITSVNASELPFTRFLTAERPDLPDFDFVASHEGQQRAREYFQNQYGSLTVPLFVLKHRGIKNLERETHRGHLQLPGTRDSHMQLIVDLAYAHLPYQVARHPTGEVLFDTPPLQKVGHHTVSQFDKEDADVHFRLFKLDLLAKRAFGQIEKTWESVRLRGKEVIPLNYSDTATFSRISMGKLGISYAESPHVRHLLHHAKNTGMTFDLEHIAQILSLARHEQSLREKYFTNVAKKTSTLETYIPTIPIAADTHGVLLYQDQVLEIAELGRLDFTQATLLRKALNGQSKSHERNILGQKLSRGLTAAGIPDTVRWEIESQLEGFRNFGFVHGHALSLAQTVYEQNYLALHYPADFWAAVLTEITNYPQSALYHSQAYVNEMLRSGIFFTFPELSDIPKHPTANSDSQVIIGKNMLGDSFAAGYSTFRNRIQEQTPEHLSSLITYQRQKFGKSFTHNPSVLFQNPPIDPAQLEQTITGQIVLQNERYRSIYVTTDIGNLVDCVLPIPDLQKVPRLDRDKTQKKYDRNRRALQNDFVTMTIKRPLGSSQEHTWTITSAESARPQNLKYKDTLQ